MKIVKSKVVCPKCKSNTLFISEIWKCHTITWEQSNGAFDRSDGYMEPGESYKLEARCITCDHRWTLRKVRQIDDITKD